MMGFNALISMMFFAGGTEITVTLRSPSAELDGEKQFGESVTTYISPFHFPSFLTDAIEKSTIGSAAIAPIAMNTMASTSLEDDFTYDLFVCKEISISDEMFHSMILFWVK